MERSKERGRERRNQKEREKNIRKDRISGGNSSFRRRNRGRNRNYHSSNGDVQISKAMSYLLRWGGKDEGLNMDENGYVDVSELLSHHSLQKKHVDFKTIQIIVSNDAKGRYSLVRKTDFTDEEKETIPFKIRANQGHKKEWGLKMDMKEITISKDENERIFAIHGTYNRHWKSILRNGLKRMERQHIHFVFGNKENNNTNKNDEKKISQNRIKMIQAGIRRSAEILLFVDMKACIRDGIRFFESANGVVLSSGNEDGVIPPKYFFKAIDSKTGEKISLMV